MKCLLLALILPVSLFAGVVGGIELRTDAARCVVMPEGARVVSFEVHGEEVFWNADPVQLRHPEWAHGGMPVCWPWFSRDAAGKFHGFAWQRKFDVLSRHESPSRSELMLGLSSDGLELVCRLTLTDELVVEMITTNRSTVARDFSMAFHPYFRIGDAGRTRISDLTPQPFDVAPRDGAIAPADGSSRMVARILDAALGRTIRIDMNGVTGVNVWNPGAKVDRVPGVLAATAWREFVAVEPICGKFRQPVRLAPGEVRKLRISVAVSGGTSCSPDLGRLLSQFRAHEVQHPVNKAAARTDRRSIEDIMSLQTDDGSFRDFDYRVTAADRGSWRGLEGQMTRIRCLAVAWYREPTERTADAFHRALGWWMKTDPVNPNWWWNEIGAPQTIGEAALIARPILTSAEQAGVVRILKRADASTKRTGQNRVWLERIRLMRGLLEEDEAVVNQGIAAIMEEVRVSDGEGVKPDGSFHQHGPQQQFGNYGLSYALNILSLAEELKDTPWQFDDAKIDVLRLLLGEGYRWICWKGMIDVSSMNRQIMPGQQKAKGDRVARALAMMKRIDPSFPTDEPVGFKFYDSSAYALYRTKDWMASVRMNTPTAKRTETWINQENTLGQVLCDGALFVYRTGREYEDVFPLWNSDWRKIPGVTSYHGVSAAEEGHGRAFNRSTECRGYECDGRAIVEWREDKEGLRAFKRWTFDSAGVVAEGREISSESGHEVVTTVEQSLARPDAEIFPYAGGRLRVRNGGIEYVIEAPEQTIHAAIEDRQGDYRAFNLQLPGCRRSGKVLSIYVSHGINPRNATYHYEIRMTP